MIRADHGRETVGGRWRVDEGDDLPTFRGGRPRLYWEECKTKPKECSVIGIPHGWRLLRQVSRQRSDQMRELPSFYNGIGR